MSWPASRRLGCPICPGMTIVHYEGPQSLDSRLTAQRAYSRRQYMYKHEGPVRRNLSAAALALFYARRGVGWKTGDLERDAPAARPARPCGRC